MKYQFQIEGAQRFEYIMGEGDFQNPEAVVEAYKALREAYTPKVGPGLIPKEWIRCVDEYRNTGTLLNGADLFHQMNEKQQFFFQELKKADKRADYKNGNKE